MLGFLAGMAGLVVGVGGLLVALDQADRLRAPAFANRLSFDEKVRLLRYTPRRDVELLLVGSSTTLHGVDGNLLRQSLHAAGVANLGVQGLRINQTHFLTDQFLPVYPHTTSVVMVSTMLDFADCKRTPAAFFNPTHVKEYLSRSLPELFYQFKYLDLRGIVEAAARIGYLRHAANDLELVSFDRSGSLLLSIPRERINQRMWKGDPIASDPTCYDSLNAMAEDLRRARVAFAYVIAPMRPSYLAARDPDGRLLAAHRRRVRRSGATVIDAHAALRLPDAAFFDAYHLNREPARRLTRYIADQIATRSAAPRHERPAGPVLAAARHQPAGVPAGSR